MSYVSLDTFDDIPTAQNRAQGYLLLTACITGNTNQIPFFSLGLKTEDNFQWVRFSCFEHLPLKYNAGLTF